ncbi:MAG: sodium:solute symporter family protein [Bacteroidales bacterium]|nr:sodium:solute symporter family protein [Bacteroidales bacterium]
MTLSSDYIQYAIIGIYFTFIITKGLLHSREINNQDDFLLAGRNIGWFFLLCTMSATVIGGGSAIGAIGRTYEWGILMLFVSTGWYLQFVFSGLFIAPKFRKLKLYTVAGFFGQTYDNKNRFLALILSLLFSVGVLGAQMVAFGKIITSMIPGISYLWAVIVGGSIVILYSTAGGLMAVIHTDVYQFIILFIGFIITLCLCIPELVAIKGKISDIIPHDFFKIDGGKGIYFAVSTFFAFLVGETFAPAYVTRFCVGKNIKATKKGITGAGLFLTLTFPVILFFIALYARYYFPDIDSEQALPRTILSLNNPIVSGIIIAALMSAVMSSADSILNSSTAIIVKDIFEFYFKKKHTDKNNLKNARIFSVVLGILGILLALVLPNIIDLLLLTYTLWAPGILLPVIVGVFSKHKSVYHNNLIFICMVTSLAGTVILMSLNMEFFRYPAVFGVLISIIVYIAGSLFLKSKKIIRAV